LPDLRLAAEKVLAALAGPSAKLREDQWEAIRTLVHKHRRALVVQRTGWGKSAVYFVATALLRGQGAGPSVIVSPLLALMRNQIAAAERAGIHAATVNSSNTDEWGAIYAQVASGHVDVLLLSPERLNNPGFRDEVLPQLAETCGLLVVDEAHCISDWGHDFRPDYRRLRTLLPELPAKTPVLATTATANARVVEDLADVLGLGIDSPEVLIQRGSLDRDSLYLGVLDLPDPGHQLAWLADHLDDWAGSGIVYTLTVATAVEVAAHLSKAGHDVLAYSGQTDADDRLEAEQALIDNRVKALVATSALGMGFDKPDLEFVIHLGAPPSPIAYYQQVGRAGRATGRADAILVPAYDDEAIWRYFGSLAFPRETEVRQVLRILGDAEAPVSTATLETGVDLSRSRLEMMLKVIDVDGAVRRVKGGWVATGAPWAYDTDRYQRVAEAKRQEQKAMRQYIRTAGCRMEFLRTELDDPGAEPCGRCDNCTGTPVPGGTTETSVALAVSSLSTPGTVIEPRKMWPVSMPELGIDVRGRIGEEESAEPGRAIANLSSMAYGSEFRELLAEGTPDGEADAAVVEAAVEVLAQWKDSWPERPGAVASIGSLRRPVLIGSIGARLAEIGRLPYLGVLEHLGDRRGREANSAHRLRSVWEAYQAPPDFVRALEQHRGAAVLLVDDFVDTGWTMTVVARMLLNLGARRVYPFALAVVG